jgi:hypothetical protein
MAWLEFNAEDVGGKLAKPPDPHLGGARFQIPWRLVLKIAVDAEAQYSGLRTRTEQVLLSNHDHELRRISRPPLTESRV